MAGTSGVKDALRRINELLYDYDNISVDVSMRNGKITITADLGQSGTRTYSARMPDADAPRRRGRKPGRPAKRNRGESGKLPTADELLAAINSTKGATMTRLSKNLDVHPRQRLAPVLLGLVREGKIRKSGLAYVTSVPGEVKRGPGRPPGSGKKKATPEKAAKPGRKPGRKAAAKKAAVHKPAAKKAGGKKVGRPAKKAPSARKAANNRGGKKNGGPPPVEIPAPAGASESKSS